MSNTFVELTPVLHGHYSLTAYCGKESDMVDDRRCLSFSVHNYDRKGKDHNYMHLTQSEVRTLIQDLQNFLDRNY